MKTLHLVGVGLQKINGLLIKLWLTIITDQFYFSVILTLQYLSIRGA